MRQPMMHIFTSTIAVILVLAACAPAQVATPDPEEVAGLVATSVALTVAIQNLETAEAQPLATETPLPTQTQAPTASPEFVEVTLPADTPIAITNTPNIPSSPNETPTVSLTPQLYACDVDTQSPGYHEEMEPGTDFDIRWVIVNTGTRTWPAGFDVKYSAGSKMTGPTLLEIPVELKPNDRYTIVLDAVAPKKDGLQYMTWVVQGQLCFPTVIINVVD